MTLTELPTDTWFILWRCMDYSGQEFLEGSHILIPISYILLTGICTKYLMCACELPSLLIAVILSIKWPCPLPNCGLFTRLIICLVLLCYHISHITFDHRATSAFKYTPLETMSILVVDLIWITKRQELNRTGSVEEHSTLRKYQLSDIQFI